MNDLGAGVQRAFDAAAESYDAAAPVQRAVAARLAEKIAAFSLPERPRILEIGCGTGFLSHALRARLPDAEWLITDLSPRMLAACRARLGEGPGVAFQVMDGERPSLEPDRRFDVICSSLAFQWFGDLGAALAGLDALLAPGGWLAFSTLAEGTLQEWRRAHAELGLECGALGCLSAETLGALVGPRGRIETETVLQAHAHARGFLGDLKAIGAGSPAPGRRPLGPKAMKQVMRRFEALGASARYEVAYCLRRRRTEARGVFVTGTDTGVGKTVVSACLARAWGADYWKPVQTGLAEESGDTAMVAALAGLPPERLRGPVHAFDPPVSPHLAAQQAGASLRLKDFSLPRSERPLVVEGAGGVLVPLNGEETMLDLMARLDLPVVLVAADRLGAINQTLLSLAALRGRGLEVLGVVLTGGPFADNRAAIEAHGKVRILAQLPQVERIDSAQIARWADGLPMLDACLA